MCEKNREARRLLAENKNKINLLAENKNRTFTKFENLQNPARASRGAPCEKQRFENTGSTAGAPMLQ